MTHHDASDPGTPRTQQRRPRVIVLGEFSAGKSTLINLLTGQRSLRTQVTATQMPPVWMSYGDAAPYRVDLDGDEHPIDPSDPATISVRDTAYLRTFIKAPVLEMCDLIDTPGNSDPNIASLSWERAARIADIAIWCSPATQAWRQSELAAWRDVPESVRARSMLLITRADKLTSEIDRAKVLGRVTREAGDLFTHIHLASLKKFGNAREVLSDLMALCQSVDVNAEAQPRDMPVAAPVAASVSRPLGHASALWQTISQDLSEDDEDGYAIAFDSFLEQLDADFERQRSQIQAAE